MLVEVWLGVHVCGLVAGARPPRTGVWTVDRLEVVVGENVAHEGLQPVQRPVRRPAELHDRHERAYGADLSANRLGTEKKFLRSATGASQNF